MTFADMFEVLSHGIIAVHMEAPQLNILEERSALP